MWETLRLMKSINVRGRVFLRAAVLKTGVILADLPGMTLNTRRLRMPTHNI